MRTVSLCSGPPIRDASRREDGVAIIYHGDAMHLVLPDESVDLIVTSPPYFALRDYRDGGESLDGQIGNEPTPAEFIANLLSATAEMVRVLKPTGSIFVNLGDKYAGSGGHNNAGIGASSDRGPRSYNKSTFNKTISTRLDQVGARREDQRVLPSSFGGVRDKSLMGLPWRYAIGCIDELGLILRQDIVWNKPNGMPESVKDRCTRNHEYWFHFTKSEHYFGDTLPIRQPAAPKTLSHKGGGKAYGNEENPDNNWSTPGVRPPDPRGVLPRSVWRITSEPLRIPKDLGFEQHFAAFPQEFPRRMILGWCPEDGVVLDPFGGTGTVAGVAAVLGRVGISVDKSQDYCRLARWRCEQSGHFEKSRPKP